MNWRLPTEITTALLLVAGLALSGSPTQGSSATGTASATLIAPATVTNDAAAELLSSASPGVLTLSIPGAGNAPASGVAGGGALLGSIEAIPTATAVTAAIATDSAALEGLLNEMSRSGGPLNKNGLLSSGQGLNLVVTHVRQTASDQGRLYAVVVYN